MSWYLLLYNASLTIALKLYTYVHIHTCIWTWVFSWVLFFSTKVIVCSSANIVNILAVTFYSLLWYLVGQLFLCYCFFKKCNGYSWIFCLYNIIAALISEDGMSFHVFWPYIFKTFYYIKFQWWSSYTLLIREIP